MATLLERGVAFLSQRLAAATEETVRIDRPSTGQVITLVGATPGTQDVLVQQGDGTILDYRPYDWLMEAENYDFGGGMVKPAEADRITVYRHGKKQVYEVLRIPGGKAWEYSDRHDTRLRIHTKLVESE